MRKIILLVVFVYVIIPAQSQREREWDYYSNQWRWGEKQNIGIKSESLWTYNATVYKDSIVKKLCDYRITKYNSNGHPHYHYFTTNNDSTSGTFFYEFDSTNSNVTNSYFMRPEGDTILYMSNTWHGNNKIITEHWYKDTTFRIYFYNETNTLDSTYHWDQGYRMPYVFIFKNDTNGNVVLKTEIYDYLNPNFSKVFSLLYLIDWWTREHNVSISTYEYDQHNNLIAVKKLNYHVDIKGETTNPSWSTLKFSYNNQNRILSEERSSSICSYYNCFKKEFSYNESNDVVEILEYEYSNKPVRQIQHIYVYDSKNNWTQMETYVNSVLIEICERKIAYN